MNFIFCFVFSSLITASLFFINKKFEYISNNILIILIGLFLLIPSYYLLHFEGIRKLSVTGYSILYFVLAVLALSDLKDKMIHKYTIYGFMFVCAVIMILNPYTTIINNLVTGLFMSIACFIIYKISNDKVGSGDVKVIAALSFALGYPQIFSLLFTSMFIAMIYGIALIITKKATVKTEIPFIPFIFIGYIINVLNF